MKKEIILMKVTTILEDACIPSDTTLEFLLDEDLTKLGYSIHLYHSSTCDVSKIENKTSEYLIEGKLALVVSHEQGVNLEELRKKLNCIAYNVETIISLVPGQKVKIKDFVSDNQQGSLSICLEQHDYANKETTLACIDPDSLNLRLNIDKLEHVWAIPMLEFIL